MKHLVAAAAVTILVSCADTPPSQVVPPGPDSDWPTYANDAGSSKFAPLDQVNRETVGKLAIAWTWASPDNQLMQQANNTGRRRMGSLGFKSTPIKIGGVLYTSTSFGHVAAINALTGAQIWVFDTKTWESGRPTNLGFNHRGVAWWAFGNQRRILMPTNNGYLWSLDADTGLPDSAFGDSGRVDLTLGLGRPVERSQYSVISAPVIAADTVIVGSSIIDRPRNRQAPPGHVRGFDVRTGKQRWIFHTIAQAGEFGNDTWEDGSADYTGNTNVWSLMSVDHKLGYVYLPIGTPTNDYYGGHRKGANLFAESLVCLDAKTGKRVWHFQMVHHGLWDYDLPAAPNLVDIEVEGKRIQAVAQVSKQGFIYVFDRVTGEPVWPIEERPVPASDVPGEYAAPTQPFPTKPAPFDLQGINEDNLINFTPELHAEALKIISAYRHGPLFTPPSLEGTIALPGQGGGANWTGAAFDRETGLFYIPSITSPNVIKLVPAQDSDMKYTVGRMGRINGPSRLPITRPPYARISAVNLNTGDYVWVKPNGNGPRQAVIDLGLPDPGPLGSPGLSGPLLTRSLLFIGGRDDKPVLRAIDKQTGEVVREVPLPENPSGTPMTYMAQGKQYIVIAGGSRTEQMLMALSLP